MKKYLTVGDLRRMLASVDDKYIVYVRVTSTGDSQGEDELDGEVFLTDAMLKTQDAHQVWARLEDADFVMLHGFVG